MASYAIRSTPWQHCRHPRTSGINAVPESTARQPPRSECGKLLQLYRRRTHPASSILQSQSQSSRMTTITSTFAWMRTFSTRDQPVRSSELQPTTREFPGRFTGRRQLWFRPGVFTTRSLNLATVKRTRFVNLVTSRFGYSRACARPQSRPHERARYFLTSLVSGVPQGSGNGDCRTLRSTALLAWGAGALPAPPAQQRLLPIYRKLDQVSAGTASKRF